MGQHIENDCLNIPLNVFFILRIIAIWGNLFGKVYSGSFSRVKKWLPEKKVMSTTFPKLWGRKPNSRKGFLVLNLTKKFTLFVLLFHINSDNKNEETQVAVT